MSRETIRSAYLRRDHVARELGITRHTLSRLLKRDLSFPRFFAITPGIEVIAREDLEHWIRQKRLSSRVKHLNSPEVAETVRDGLLQGGGLSADSEGPSTE